MENPALILIDVSGDTHRDECATRCIHQGYRLESDDLIYNAFGIPVARYIGNVPGRDALQTIVLETQWEKARILMKECHYVSG